MKALEEKDIKLKKVLTKTGAELLVIEISPQHFFIEQNYKKKSKYGIAYKQLKERYPQFFMFWEIRNNRYTGRLLLGTMAEKEEIDRFITSILQDEEYKSYPVEQEEV